MKALKNISLFRISILLIINIFSKSSLILILTITYLLICNYKSLIVFICTLILISFTNNYSNDFIKYGVVEDISNEKAVIDKILYKVNVYNNENLIIGDIVYFINESNITKSNNLKYNIRFDYSNKVETIYNIKLKKYMYERINDFNDDTSKYIKKILINDNSNDNEIENIGYGFAFYYILLLLLKKNRKLLVIFLILYVVIFRFDTKFYLIIIDLLIQNAKLDRIDKYSIKVILLLLINYNLIQNYSILISLLFSLYYISEFKKDTSYITIAQSLLFNEIHIFTSFFYKYLVYLRICLFILCIFTIIFKPFEIIFISIIKIYSSIFDYFDISIKGKMNIFIFLIYILVIKLLNIKNKYIKTLVLILLMISPINNPIMHISFIDVGQGDSILIHGPFSSYNILIDTGSKYNYSKLKRELNKQSVYKIDYLIITHDDLDHSGNIENLEKDFKIKKIVHDGENINIGNIYLEYLYIGNFDNDNDNSLCYLLNIDGYKVLFTGDISSKVENFIINKLNITNIDILKVSHHGSKSATSKYFISNLLPRYAVISTSGAYNHPNKEVINILDSFLINTYITKDDGTITFYFTYILDFIKTGIGQFVII